MEEQKAVKIRKVFSVIIHDREYDVYDIEGKEHSGLNDTPKDWWLYYAERLPEGLLPSVDSDSWEPWSVGINRMNWEVSIKQKNSSKEKWGETQFNNHTWVTMKCNGKDVYEFGTVGGGRGMDYAMHKIGYLQTALCEHCYNFFEPEKENGRKIYYKGLPATIRPSSHPGEIGIIPDYTCGLNKQQWWAELKRRESKIGGEQDKEWEEIEAGYTEEYEHQDYINWGSALEDSHINWFRK